MALTTFYVYKQKLFYGGGDYQIKFQALLLFSTNDVACINIGMALQKILFHLLGAERYDPLQ